MNALTLRELVHLDLAARGYSAREAAALLLVSTATVRTHRNTVLAKLHARTIGQAIATAFRTGQLG